MEIQAVCDNFAAILLHSDDILNKERCAYLVRQALRERGIEPWHDMEIECFSGTGATMILARPCAQLEVSIADYAKPFFKEYLT